MKFEDILARVGDEGRFQVLLMALLLVPTSVYNAFFDNTHLFLSSPKYWCDVPALTSASDFLQQELIRGPDGTRCSRYDLNYDLLSNRTQLPNNFTEMLSVMNVANLSDVGVISCNNFQYDRSLYTETATTYFNLVCDREFWKSKILEVHISGVPILTPFMSLLSDRFGRRDTLLFVFILAELSCVTPLFVKNLPTLFITRFFSGGVLNAYYQLPFVLTQELVSARYRTRASCLSALFYSLGAVLTPLIAQFTRGWVGMTWVPFLVTMPYIILYRFLPESPFWLISKRKFREAHDQLAMVARVNGKPVPPTLMADIEMLETLDKKETLSINGEPERKDTLWDLFTMPGLRFKTFGLTCVFVACYLTYSGVNINTINHEADEQLSMVLTLALVDLPALFIFWFLVDSPLGRRWSNVIGLSICALGLLIPALAGAQRIDSDIVKYSAWVGKFGIAGVFMVVYQHASELFPTTLRNQGIGICATFAATITIATPELVKLSMISAWIPLFILSMVCLLAAIVSSFLPETLNEFLPERAHQAAELGRNRQYWSLANWRKSEKVKDTVTTK